MTCTSCGDKPKGSSKGFPRAVVEINNPESLVLLRKVVIPVSMGTEEDVPPAIGKYFNVLLQYESNGHIYLYSSDGIPTAIEANIPQEVLDRIDQLEIDVDLLETGLANETEAREAADSALSSSIDSLSSSLSAETAAREQADAALEGDINNLTADLEEEVTARETADTALGGRIDTVANNLATETANRISADEDLQAGITAEATARANADTALNTAITSEVTARQEADTNLQNQITQETQARTAADTAINGAITAEATTRQTADAGLQSQIDAITAGSDVKDIVGTKAELNNYDTSTLGNNDIIKVLQDESENNATTYYRWNATTQQFTLIGEEGPYYTKSQADTLLNAKQNTLTAGSNVQIVNDTISATDTTYTAGTGLALNGTQFSVDTTTIATQSDLTAGLATKQDTLAAGTNIQINNNTISATDTTYTHFTGATASTDGVQGLVPGPLAGDEDKFLKADGTWDTVGSSVNVVQATGTSTADVMSQNAVTSMVYADPSTTNAVKIGKSTSSNTQMGTAVGWNAFASGVGSVALGAGSSAPNKGEMNIGAGLATYGYNNSTYRLLTGLYDGQNDHDAATKGQLDSAVAGIESELDAKQDVLTAGDNITIADESGDLVISATDTTYTAGTGINISNGVISATSTGPTVVQTTGTSTTDVMSQNAVTSMVFADPGNNNKVQIGKNNSASGMNNFGYVIAGNNNTLKNTYGGVLLGDHSNVGANNNSSYAVAIGSHTNATGNQSVALGYYPTASGANSIAIGGSDSTLTVASAYNSIALGGARATVQGQFDVSTGTNATGGYNSSNYRLISGVYDPQSAHDAATKGYVDTAVGAKQDVLTAGDNITIAEESGALVISATGGSSIDTFTTNEWNALWA